MWSVGCILGELLGGKPIFKGKEWVGILNQLMNAHPSLKLCRPTESDIANTRDTL